MPVNAYARYVDPEGLVALGTRNRVKAYRKNVPGIVDVADALLTLCRHTSDLSLPKPGYRSSNRMGRAIERRIKHQHVVTLAEVLSVLVGRRGLLFEHRNAKLVRPDKVRRTNQDGITGWIVPPDGHQMRVAFWVQEIAWRLDPTTGEIDDVSAADYVRKCAERGFLATLYKTSTNRYGCLVWIGYELLHPKAMAIARELATSTEGVDFRFSTFFTSIPAPLSVRGDGELCAFLDVEVKDSLTVLDKIISHQNQVECSLEPIAKVVPEVVAPPSEVPDPDKHASSKLEVERWYPTDWTVDQWMREECVQLVGPRNPAMLRLVGHLLFGSWRDGEAAVVDTQLMEAFTEKKSGKNGIVYRTLKRLHTILPIQINPHQRHGKATSYQALDLPANLAAVRDAFGAPMKSPVSLVTGKRAVIVKSSLEQTRRQQSAGSTTLYPSPTAERLLGYLNNLPVNSFRMRTRGEQWERILAEVDLLPPNEREAEPTHLKGIQEAPRPIYKRAEQTTRIYAIGDSFQTLRGDLRKVVFADCHKFDLKHAQLSIAAMLFQADFMTDLLTRDDTWDYLTSTSGLSKRRFKELLYLSLYMERISLKDAIEGNDSSFGNDYHQFLSVPEIVEFMECRRRFILHELPRKEVDVFGNLLVKEPWNSCLAALIQSHEMMCFSKVVDHLASLNNPRNRMLLWLHDGFYMTIRTQDVANLTTTITRLVEQHLMEWKIPSRLIWEEPSR